jgi:hypothetical protein
MKPDSGLKDFRDLDQLPPEERADLLARSRRIAVGDLGLGFYYAILILFTLLLAFSIASAPFIVGDLSALQSVPFIGLGAVGALFIFRLLEKKILRRGYEELQRRIRQSVT